MIYAATDDFKVLAQEYKLVLNERVIKMDNERKYNQYFKAKCVEADAAREIWTEFCGILNDYRDKNGIDMFDPAGEANLDGATVEFIAYKEHNVHAPLFEVAKKYSAHIENLDMYGW